MAPRSTPPWSQPADCHPIMASHARGSAIFPRQIIHYGGHTFVNYTVPPGYSWFAWSIYQGEDRLEVPMLEVVAQVLLVMSILSVLVLIWFRKRPPKDPIIGDSWAPARTVDYAVRLYNFVGIADLLLAIMTLLLMTVPIAHSGTFANWLYACEPRVRLRPLSASPLPDRAHSKLIPSPAHLRPQLEDCSTICPGCAACTVGSPHARVLRSPP